MVLLHDDDADEEEESMTLRVRDCFSHRFLVQSIFLLLGIGALVPWNAFISAKPYFESRLCTSDRTNYTEASHDERMNHYNIESTFSMVYNVSSVVTMLLVIGIQMWRDRKRVTDDNQRDLELSKSQILSIEATAMDPSLASLEEDRDPALSCRPTDTQCAPNSIQTPNNESSHSFWLVTVPLLLFLLVFILQSIMVLAVHVPHFYSWTLLCLAACGMASGIAGAGFVAAAGAFPPALAMNPYQLVRVSTCCRHVLPEMVCCVDGNDSLFKNSGYVGRGSGGLFG
jgi:hypothetical protein